MVGRSNHLSHSYFLFPCRMFGPVFEKASEEHGDIVFGKVDTEAQQDLAATFGVQSIPTTVFMRDRVMLGSVPGAMGAPQLASILQQVRDLDMEAVRAETAAQSGDQA